jgi:trehalose-phosphatase
MPPRYFFEANPLEGSARNRLVLFLDFDGTLTPITRDPSRPCLSPPLRHLLEGIRDTGRTTVVIISGRSLQDLRRRTCLRGVYHAGSHGFEISGPGVRFVHEAARSSKPILDAIRADLESVIGACEGVSMENKPYSIALHHRAAGRATALSLRSLLRERLTAHADGARRLKIIRGKKVLEIVPRVSWDKGAAALEIMRRLPDKGLPVCVGDDATDETLFLAFRESGVTVRVGTSQRTAAEYYLRGQWEVPLLLQGIVS